MAASSRHPLLQYLRRLSAGKAGDAALDDAQFLARFLTSRDESAFTTLVQRCGAMVWRLCVRPLGQTPEAEDAFQATFLTFVRKAGSISRRGSIAAWLYKVAYRVALESRRISRTSLPSLTVWWPNATAIPAISSKAHRAAQASRC
jgi:DNA-directed RNA polymerase specialized sigma24 family protein